MELRGKRVLVVGAGRSGAAAARFLASRGAATSLYDDAPAESLAERTAGLQEVGIALVTGGSPLTGTWDLAVPSPGVPHTVPVMRSLQAQGVPLVGEFELASRFLGAPILAVTGTNGKTTVVELLGEILRQSGRRVFVGGNVGTPLVEAVGGDAEVVVAEVSSFQLETADSFHPRVAVLLNVTDDHRDRHPDLGDYARIKARIFARQRPGDMAIVNADDPLAWQVAQELATGGPGLIPYSTRRPLGAGAWVEGEDMVFLLPGSAPVRLPRGELSLTGDHNLGNALAACLAAQGAGVSAADAWRVARSFRGLPHRLQLFLEWRGVRFVDDSKATNVDAALRALEAVAAPVVWLAGGSDKGADFSPLAAALRRSVRHAVLVGASAPAMETALAGSTQLQVCPDWGHAVHTAVDAARPGDTVLLSPACASFDFFRGYAHRGDVFQDLCRRETTGRDADGR